LEDLEHYFLLLVKVQQCLLRIHELQHLLPFHRCLVFFYLIYFQPKLCEILGQIHLEDLGHYFFLLVKAQQYLQRIHELLHLLPFHRYLAFFYLIYFQSRLCEILGQIHLEDLGHCFFLLVKAQRCLLRIHELQHLLPFHRYLAFFYLIYFQLVLYGILGPIHLEDLVHYFF
jgi:hypothetical protein